MDTTALTEEQQRPAWAGKMLDLEKLVAEHDPDAPKPWVVEPLIIAGMLAIVAGKGGSGKTWVIHEAADAVARGKTNAGMRGAGPLPVLIIDAEMGAWLTTDRFKQQGYSTDIKVFNAQGMDLRNTADRQLIWDAALAILGPRGGLLLVDSLRAIVPSAKENESDDMGPVVTWIRQLCRTTNAAGILVHHAGWREDRTRGSSAIKDQADTVWYLGRGDSDGETLKLSARGEDLKSPRWGPPPHDLYLRIREEGGLVLADEPVTSKDRTRDQVLEAVRAAEEAGEPLGATKAELARALGLVTVSSALSEAVKQLVAEGELLKSGKNWTLLDHMTTARPAI